MATMLTVREVPDEVRDALVRQARDHGQSLQAFVLGVLKRQADFSRNLDLIAEIEEDLAGGGGAGADAPAAAEILDSARAERGGMAGEPGAPGPGNQK